MPVLYTLMLTAESMWHLDPDMYGKVASKRGFEAIPSGLG